MENQEAYQKFGNGTRVSLSRENLLLHNQQPSTFISQVVKSLKKINFLEWGTGVESLKSVSPVVQDVFCPILWTLLCLYTSFPDILLHL